MKHSMSLWVPLKGSGFSMSMGFTSLMGESQVVEYIQYIPDGPLVGGPS